MGENMVPFMSNVRTYALKWPKLSATVKFLDHGLELKDTYL